jgi:AbrB family looped-hinge helix DNA binding protein
MKPTGIVRKVDELGRVVIPREIRRTMKIRSGSDMEFSAQGGGLLVKSVKSEGECLSLLTLFAESVSSKAGIYCAVTCKNKVAVSVDKTVKKGLAVSPKIADKRIGGDYRLGEVFKLRADTVVHFEIFPFKDGSLIFYRFPEDLNAKEIAEFLFKLPANIVL